MGGGALFHFILQIIGTDITNPYMAPSGWMPVTDSPVEIIGFTLQNLNNADSTHSAKTFGVGVCRGRDSFGHIFFYYYGTPVSNLGLDKNMDLAEESFRR